MCRYGMHTYKQHYACFKCYKVFRKPWLRDASYVCPDCGGPLRAMGLDFKTPRQSDRRQWRLVEAVLRQGIDYHSCGCGVGERPRNRRDIAEFVRLRNEDQERIRRAMRV